MSEIIVPGSHPHPLAGTPAGDAARDKFVAAMLDILGDSRLLIVPKIGDTTTSTSEDRLADVVTWDATIAARLGSLGSGMSLDFDGTDDEGDTPDSADHSFGDGAVDQPFSVVALVNPDVVNTEKHILGKFNTTSSLREWAFKIDGNGYPGLVLYDQSASASLEREDATALTVGSWVLLCATYDGSRADTGITVYKDGVAVDDAGGSSGSYTAMENLTEKVLVGHFLAGSTVTAPWNGKMALACLTGKALSIEDVWAIKALCNGFFDLAL